MRKRGEKRSILSSFKSDGLEKTKTKTRELIKIYREKEGKSLSSTQPIRFPKKLQQPNLNTNAYEKKNYCFIHSQAIFRALFLF